MTRAASVSTLTPSIMAGSSLPAPVLQLLLLAWAAVAPLSEAAVPVGGTMYAVSEFNPACTVYASNPVLKINYGALNGGPPAPTGYTRCNAMGFDTVNNQLLTIAWNGPTTSTTVPQALFSCDVTANTPIWKKVGDLPAPYNAVGGAGTGWPPLKGATYYKGGYLW